MATPNGDTIRWLRSAPYFMISYAAGFVVVTSLSYTDQVFYLLVLALQLCLLVEALAKIAEYFNAYATQFVFETFSLLFVLMAPMYFFQMLKAPFNQSPLPTWYEALSYIPLLMIVVLALVATVYTDTVRSLSGTAHKQNPSVLRVPQRL